MIPHPLEGQRERPTADPLPRLCAATDRLRRLAAIDTRQFGFAQRSVIDEVMTAAVQAEQTLAVQRARIRYLESLSATDELTGLLNRRGFHVDLDRALARAQRAAETGLLVLCDLNQFKTVNDDHGHLAGDAVLRAVARLLRARTRRNDSVARLGGDEFAVLMPQSAREQGLERVAALASLVNSLVVEWRRQRIPVTASFGFECYDGDSRPDTLLYLADRAMYRRKHPRLLRLATKAP